MKKLFAVLLILLSGVALADDQKRYAPTNEDLQDLARQRLVVEKLLSPAVLQSNYLTAPGKLGALRAVIAAKKFNADQTAELQSLGVVFGDAFVADMGFHWIVVDDAYGRTLALQYKESSVILFPRTMISKRIERGETVDVFDLYNGVAAAAQDKIDKESKKK